MADYDPTSITTFENFMHEGWGYAEFKGAVATMNAGTAADVASSWSTFSVDAVNGIEAFMKVFREQIPMNWKGAAAEAVRARAEAYSATRLDVATQIGGVATSLFSAIDGITKLKGSIGAAPVSTFSAQYAEMVLPLGTASAADRALETQAREDMIRFYEPAYRATDQEVPAFDRPPSLSGTPITFPGAVPTPSGSPSSQPFSGEPGTTPEQAESEVGAPESGEGSPEPATTAPTSATPASTMPSSTAGPGTGSDTAQPRSGMQNPNESAGTRSGAGGGGFGGGGAGAFAGGGVGYGGGGSGGGFGSRSSGPGLLGAPVGAPGSGAAGGSGARGGAVGTSGRGMGAGMGGMMGGGGARAQGGEDGEHKTPDYLINIDNGNALIGTMPLVAPPVIGG